MANLLVYATYLIPSQTLLLSTIFFNLSLSSSKLSASCGFRACTTGLEINVARLSYVMDGTVVLSFLAALATLASGFRTVRLAPVVPNFTITNHLKQTSFVSAVGDALSELVLIGCMINFFRVWRGKGWFRPCVFLSLRARLVQHILQSYY